MLQTPTPPPVLPLARPDVTPLVRPTLVQPGYSGGSSRGEGEGGGSGGGGGGGSGGLGDWSALHAHYLSPPPALPMHSLDEVGSAASASNPGGGFAGAWGTSVGGHAGMGMRAAGRRRSRGLSILEDLEPAARAVVRRLFRNCVSVCVCVWV